MGFAISWLAVQTSEPREVLAALGLTAIGKREEIPESPILGAALPGGWFLIFTNDFDSPLVSEKAAVALSAGAQVISCKVEEHVMFSSATCHVNRARTWHVEHDAQENIYHLNVSGDLPVEFKAIYAGLKKQQDAAGGEKADVDYIHDVPVTLAQSITSFRHDQDIPGAPGEPFEVLQRRH